MSDMKRFAHAVTARLNLHMSVVAAVGCVVLAASLCHAEAKGKTFKLKVQPMPGEGGGGFGWYASSLRPVNMNKPTTLPQGVKPEQAYEADLRGGGGERRKLIVVKRGKPASFDRLYIDANGDGSFSEDECYDISKSNGPVTRHSQRVLIRPVKLTAQHGEQRVDRWIMIQVYAGNTRVSHLLYTSVTAAMGKVAFGDKEVLLGLYLRQPFAGRGPIVRRVELPSEAAQRQADRGRSVYINYGTPLLIDQNGNGRFDNTTFYGPGGEATSLTKLVRFGDAYYAVDVADDATSITITPTKPKLGTLAIPDDLRRLTILGEVTAREVNPTKQRKVELPLGKYVVFGYDYRTKTGQLYCRDYRGDAIFAIEADKTTEITVGPPLKAGVTARVNNPRRSSSGRESARSVYLSLALADRAGRSLSSLTTAKGKQPPPPKFEIRDGEGKVIHSGTFEYG